MPPTPPAPVTARTAADPTGSLLVSVDDRGRVVRVDVAVLDESLRTSGALDAAVARAHLTALVHRRPERTATLPRAAAPGPRPPRIRLTNPWTEGRDIEMPDFEWARQVNDAAPGRVAGVSDNECITVTLAPGSVSGGVVADDGWLRRAESRNVAAALTQAFASAYRKRDGR